MFKRDCTVSLKFVNYFRFNSQHHDWRDLYNHSIVWESSLQQWVRYSYEFRKSWGNDYVHILDLPIIPPLNVCFVSYENWVQKLMVFVGSIQPVQVHFTLRLMDQQSMWMQDGCKVYPYMALYGSCFTVTRTIFKNHLLHVGLTQNQETMALQTLTTANLFYCIMWEDSHE